VRFVTAKVDDSWQNPFMTIPSKRPQAAPALFRLLSESALSRAALGCCGVAVAIVEAGAKARTVSYANAAFESLFGHAGREIDGKPLSILFRNDDALVQRMLDAPRRWELTAWAKDGSEHPVEVSVAAVRSVEGGITHWVLAFADRGEVERLREEVQSLRGLAAASIAVRLDDRHADLPAPATHPDR
jgi:PAS domain S-box-containing protein